MWAIIMNINKAINVNNINNGRSIINTGNQFQTLDTSKDTDPTLASIQNLNDLNFDDPNYYWLCCNYTSPVTPSPTVTPTITPTITPSVSQTPISYSLSDDRYRDWETDRKSVV